MRGVLSRGVSQGVTPGIELPLTLLTRYLFFLSRRPISSSNRHFLARRLSALQSLAEPLAAEPRLSDAVDLVRRLSPTTFQLQAPQAIDALAVWAPPELPADAVQSTASPRSDFLGTVRRVRLIFGPGIGIGDEILGASLLAHLRLALGPSEKSPSATDLDFEAWTGYSGLWIPGREFARVTEYRGYGELLEALRPAADDDDDDDQLTILLDFEKPALVNAVASEGRLGKYVEISLGARAIWALRADRRWLHHFSPAPTYLPHHYLCLERMIGWLAGQPAGTDAARRFSAWPGRQDASPGDGTLGAASLRILVSPFTSKYEPRLDLWVRLLAGLSSVMSNSEVAGAGIEWVLDSGPNRATERFASHLAGAIRSTSTHVRMASSRDDRTLSLPAVLSEIEAADVVLCCDSFAAHAAAQAAQRGKPTLVLAGAGLQAWRVPGKPSFYFEEALPIGELVAAMGLVMAAWAGDNRAIGGLFGVSAAAVTRQAGELAQQLAQQTTTTDAAVLVAAYDALCRDWRRLQGELRVLDDASRGLLADHDYAAALPPLTVLPGDDAPAVIEFIEHQLELWRNSNLFKLCQMLHGRPEGSSDHRIDSENRHG